MASPPAGDTVRSLPEPRLGESCVAWDRLSVLDDLLESAGVGIDQAEDRRVLVVLVEADVPGGVTVARRRGRAQRNRVALRDVRGAVLFGDRVELRAVAEKRRLEVREATRLSRLSVTGEHAAE